MEPAALDDIIYRLLDLKQATPGKQVQLLEGEIRQLCTVAREIFLQQPNLLELEAPIKICALMEVTVEAAAAVAALLSKTQVVRVFGLFLSY
ncbi:hypothetical protein V6N11_002504 [Hibiscus sabdariffa]|uniref:protein-serine/threonine phosphatase n=1 Tax=Hibiscus sabdariffa TaxID=183260 RepID=A0ABR2SBB4_9ROSI